MHTGFDLKLEQTQKIIITPELRQAIALLQMSALQLQEHLQEELLSNPVLEWEEEGKKEEAAEKAEDKEGAESKEEKEEHPREEFPWEDYFQESYPVKERGYNGKEHSSFSLEDFCREEDTLFDYLFSQLRLITKEEEHFLAEYLVGCLDSRGYLSVEPEDIASSLGVSCHRVNRVLQIMHEQLEPAGIGARNLRECLLLQLKRRQDHPPLAKTLIREHLPAVGDGRFRYLSDRLKVALEEVMEAVDYIRSLNPKPGSFWGQSTDTRYIIPDVVVEEVEGQYVVTVNDGASPHLKISPYYRSLLHRKEGEASSFVKKHLDSALWLLKCIEQRRLTLYRVSEYIVQLQKDFLEGGLKYLRPLTLRKVAHALDLHESTVSRATSNKYIQTPRGVFPFRFFFSSGLGGENGVNVSSTSIKSALKELIQHEPPGEPYSDSRIAHIFEERGVQISRRTVAKYREELRIPASHKRRQACWTRL